MEKQKSETTFLLGSLYILSGLKQGYEQKSNIDICLSAGFILSGMSIVKFSYKIYQNYKKNDIIN